MSFNFREALEESKRKSNVNCKAVEFLESLVDAINNPLYPERAKNLQKLTFALEKANDTRTGNSFRIRVYGKDIFSSDSEVILEKYYCKQGYLRILLKAIQEKLEEERFEVKPVCAETINNCMEAFEIKID